MEESEVSKLQAEHIKFMLGKCKHFNGIQNAACKAGINYHELLGSEFGCFANMPCTRAPVPSAACASFALFTQAEAEAEADEWVTRMKRFKIVLTGAHEHAEKQGFKRGRGGVGELECPSGCGGKLRYSVAEVNGHMHAACTTKGCCSWME